MIKPTLSRGLKKAIRHSKSFHSSPRSRLGPRGPIPVARLLETSPNDPDNVVVNGFIRSIRNQKQRSFASIGDGSSLEPLQALLTPQQAQSLTTGTAVSLTGSWRKSPNAKAQSHELHVKEVDIIGPADPATFPLQKKYHTPEYLRTMPHIRTRTPFNSTLLRFRSDVIASITTFFSERDFVQTHTPIITSSDCEGAGEVFQVRSSQQRAASKEDDGSFFKSPKYLTVSGQLHLEALAHSVGKVWTLSPTFRAEKSDTARHLSEFYMLEAEVSFVEKMEDVMDLVTDMIREATKILTLSNVEQELKHGKRSGDEERDISTRAEELDLRWNGIRAEWPRITYTDAISLLQSSPEKFEHEPKWGSGLQAEHERYIAKTVGTSSEGYSPVFVTHYPKAIKPFYMLSSPPADRDRETVECFDLLVPEACEIVGGSMREHRLPQLLESMRTNGMLPPGSDELSDEDLEKAGLKWYVDLRRWGSVPHGGFGLGFDRLLGYLAGVQNIREMVTFPRWVGRCDC